jgi:hypothetical protein
MSGSRKSTSMFLGSTRIRCGEGPVNPQLFLRPATAYPLSMNLGTAGYIVALLGTLSDFTFKTVIIL